MAPNQLYNDGMQQQRSHDISVAVSSCAATADAAAAVTQWDDEIQQVSGNDGSKWLESRAVSIIRLYCYTFGDGCKRLASLLLNSTPSGCTVLVAVGD